MRENARQQLADFLRARREALTPIDAGISSIGRRRVKGLKRSEVAEMAGISTDWYSWIEQARDVNLSQDTLKSLATALRLNTQERDHIFRLAGHSSPDRANAIDSDVVHSIQQLIDSMTPNPAYALDSNWYLVAWNTAAVELFGDFALLPPAERNMVRLAFTNPKIKSLYLNWDEYARCTLAHFRLDSAAHIDEPHWVQLIEQMRAASLDFDLWWQEHNVHWPHSWIKHMLHPTRGQVTYKTFDFEMWRPAHLRIVSYIDAQSITNR